jgi:hypothetical protein
MLAVEHLLNHVVEKIPPRGRLLWGARKNPVNEPRGGRALAVMVDATLRVEQEVA